jgi:hypothetical protein
MLYEYVEGYRRGGGEDERRKEREGKERGWEKERVENGRKVQARV